jgi:4-aminobutyrate aminotransferase and related aminotransferases
MIILFSSRPQQAYRVFNTWMGDPGKVLLLKGIIDTIHNENLLDRVQKTGDILLNGKWKKGEREREKKKTFVTSSFLMLLV